MTVFENLEFHGRYFGMSAQAGQGAWPPSCCNGCG